MTTNTINAFGYTPRFSNRAVREQAEQASHIDWSTVTPTGGNADRPILTKADVARAIAQGTDGNFDRLSEQGEGEQAFNASDPRTWASTFLSLEEAGRADARFGDALATASAEKARADVVTLASISDYMLQANPKRVLGLDRLSMSDVGTDAHDLGCVNAALLGVWKEGLATLLPHVFGADATAQARNSARTYRATAQAMAERAVRPFHTLILTPVCIEEAVKPDGAKEFPRTFRWAWVRATGNAAWSKGTGSTVKGGLSDPSNTVTVNGKDVAIIQSFVDDDAPTTWRKAFMPRLVDCCTDATSLDKAEAQTRDRVSRAKGSDKVNDDVGSTFFNGMSAEDQGRFIQLREAFRLAENMKGETRERAITVARRHLDKAAESLKADILKAAETRAA